MYLRRNNNNKKKEKNKKKRNFKDSATVSNTHRVWFDKHSLQSTSNVAEVRFISTTAATVLLIKTKSTVCSS